MATIKMCTDIPQSKKLAEFLPFESADMCYIKHASSDNPTWRFDDDIPPMILGNVPINEVSGETLPCWSLAALLNVLQRMEYLKIFIDLSSELDSNKVAIYYASVDTPYIVKDNLIDACYEMIIKLHELKML
jgi:hypothetical protein